MTPKNFTCPRRGFSWPPVTSRGVPWLSEPQLLASCYGIIKQFQELYLNKRYEATTPKTGVINPNFKEVSKEVAQQFETLGSEAFSHIYGMAASRIPFLVKDPRGWNEFRLMLGEHSAKGSANTMLGVQADRPSLYDLEARLENLNIPTLVVVGDEDDHCLNPGIFLKRAIPTSGLHVIPRTGHTLNLEEPDLFNQVLAEFFSMVEENRWTSRDPRSKPSEIMKTS